jgi:hypothetical protein
LQTVNPLQRGINLFCEFDVPFHLLPPQIHEKQKSKQTPMNRANIAKTFFQPVTIFGN